MNAAFLAAEGGRADVARDAGCEGEFAKLERSMTIGELEG